MRRGTLSLFFLLALLGSALAAIHYPALTGRVVDDAGVLSAGQGAALEQQLAAFESESGTQLVVATLPSLQGDTIEDYGYQLGRNWGIGQKGKDNGALLIVALQEKKVRIEVGYG
ncbi:MAG: TPM domain-containing protein, partial [Pseudomonadota bacterium]|nr:TPM domain-containing protein [Pseudomonadota bacterium]